MTGGEAFVCTRVESETRVEGPTDGWVHRLVEKRREEPEAIYSYRDEQGGELFQVVRFPGKRIRQRRRDPGHPDAKADGFVWSLGEVRRVLYRLPELIAADAERIVWVVEGEKDVDTLIARGEIATCNPHGAGPGKWERTAELARKHLVGRDVVIVADDDGEGIAHGRRTAASIRDVARSTRLVTCGLGKDITDHLAAGGTFDDLVFVFDEALTPDPGPPPDMFDEPETAPAPIAHHAPEAEAALVGAALAVPECMAAAAELVSPGDILDPKLAMIYGAAFGIHASGLRVDPVSVSTWLRDHQHLEEIGGLDALTSIANVAALSEPTREISASHALIVREKSIARSFIAVASNGLDGIAKANGTSSVLMAALVRELASIESRGAKRERIEWISGASLAEPEPPASYLLPALGLTDGSGPPHMFAGRGESGKTLLCQDLLLSLAAGRHAWGAYEPARAFRVAHIDLEQGRRLTKTRYQRLARARGFELADVPLDIACFPKDMRLDASQVGRWTDAMGDHDVILIDSLRVAMRGFDENSSEFREGLDLLGQISEVTRCRALVIHHLRKSSKEASDFLEEMIRGSAAIYEALDCCFILRKSEGEDVSVHQKKAREHGEHCDPFSFHVSNVDGPSGPRWGVRISIAGMEKVEEQRASAATERLAKEQGAAKVRVLIGLQRHPDSTCEDLAQRIGMRPAAVRLALRDLSMSDPPKVGTREEPSEGGRPRRLYRAI